MVTAPVQPDPLPRPALDSHTHLDMIRLPIGQVVAAARAAGIARIVTVGTDLESSRWSARCAAEHDAVYAAAAIHPNHTASAAASTRGGEPFLPGGPIPPDPPWGPPAHGRAARPPVSPGEVLAGIEALARLPRVVAVGETGLDYYRDHAPPDVQRWWFREHIKIAKQ